MLHFRNTDSGNFIWWEVNTATEKHDNDTFKCSKNLKQSRTCEILTACPVFKLLDGKPMVWSNKMVRCVNTYNVNGHQVLARHQEAGRKKARCADSPAFNLGCMEKKLERSEALQGRDAVSLAGRMEVLPCHCVRLPKKPESPQKAPQTPFCPPRALPTLLKPPFLTFKPSLQVSFKPSEL